MKVYVRHSAQPEAEVTPLDEWFEVVIEVDDVNRLRVQLVDGQVAVRADHGAVIVHPISTNVVKVEAERRES